MKQYIYIYIYIQLPVAYEKYCNCYFKNKGEVEIYIAVPSVWSSLHRSKIGRRYWNMGGDWLEHHNPARI